MHSTSYRLLCVTIATFVMIGCTNQSTPINSAPTIGNAKEVTLVEFSKQFPQESSSRNRAFLANPLAPQCTTPPTQTEVNTAQLSYQDYYMSAKRAASLQIPVVNASGQSDFLVIVRDYKRYKPCTATDNKTVLQYGQVIRAVIELTSYQADVKLAVAMLAANATISGKQQYFYLYKDGWYNPGADGIIAEVSGKVFDVENYGLYQGIMPRLIALLSQTTTTLTPAPIFRIPPEDDENFVMAAARAYGFNQAKDGKSCQDAIKKFETDPARSAAIVDAYSFLGKPNCTAEKTIEPEKSKAAGYLGGLSVK